MVTLAQLTSNILVKINEATNRTVALPILIFFPTARCNSGCISCDWWKSDGVGELTLEEIRQLTAQLPALRTRLVTFSGGEPTLRRDVYKIAALFRAHAVKLHLLTSGLFLERDAAAVVEHFEHVTVSLDAHTPAQYERIRGVNGLAALERGVKKVKTVSPRTGVRARSTLHRHNFAELAALIDKARAMGLDGISFLAADVSAEAFGRNRAREQGGGTAPAQALLLDRIEVAEFRQIVEDVIASHASDFASGFIAESPMRLRRLPQYYAAQQGMDDFPVVQCNAPWTSAVIEANGAVRPCFFHQAVGNIRERPLREIMSREMVAFRRALDVAHNATCRRCVCSLRVGLRTAL